MLALVKIALAPILLAQGKSVRRNTLRLPEPQGARAGIALPPAAQDTRESPLRLLVLGDSSAAGVGVETQREALAQPLAEGIASLLQRPVAWQLFAKTGLDTLSMQDFLSPQVLPPADVVVSFLGVNDVTAQRSPQAFIQHYDALRALVLSQVQSSKTSSPTHWLAASVPPMQHMRALPQPLRWYMGRYAHGLNLALQQWAGATAHLHLIAAPPQLESDELAADGFHPGKAHYAAFAQHLASSVQALCAQQTRLPKA